MPSFMYVCMYVCVYVCMYVCMYVCVYVCVGVCACVCVLCVFPMETSFNAVATSSLMDGTTLRPRRTIRCFLIDDS
jgi:hypothetical protein